MIFRIITIIMAMLIFAGPILANGVVLADCREPTCCCNSMTMAGHGVNISKIQSQRGCCCADAAGSTCRLETVAPSKNICWALSPNRVDPSGSHYVHASNTEDPSFLSAAAFATDFKDRIIHQASQPTYLILMSFLC